MNVAPPDPQPAPEISHPDESSWSGWRWLSYLALAFGLHIVVFYFLADRKPPIPRPVKNAATLHLLEAQTEPQQLDDPTLFALPHPRGFAANTWLRLPQITFASFRWTEPPRLLPLPLEQLGTIFLKQAEANPLTRRELDLIATPLTSVVMPTDDDNQRTTSTLRIKGIPASRQLRRSPGPLPSFPARETLTNTVIKILVDARGQVLSPTLFHPGSGSKEADQTALKLAHNLWFNRAPNTTPLASGWLIFEWATTPATNAPATTP